MKCPLSCINAISTLGWLTGSTKVQLHGVPLCTKLRLFVLCMSRGAFSLLFMDFWRISDLEDSALIPSASSFGPCSASILGEHLSHLWLIHFQIRGSVHFDVTKAEKDVLKDVMLFVSLPVVSGCLQSDVRGWLLKEPVPLSTVGRPKGLSVEKGRKVHSLQLLWIKDVHKSSTKSLTLSKLSVNNVFYV